MEKKKVLIFIDWFLPGYKAGGPVRSMANMVEYLGEEYAFFVYTSNKDHDGTKLNVQNDKWVDFGEQKTQIYYSSKASYGEIKGMLEEVYPDVVYLNSLFSVKYTVFPLVINRFFKNISISKIVLAPRGMFQKGALQLKSSKKRLFLTVVKPLLFRVKNIIWHATDEQEVKDIRDEMGAKVCIKQVGNIPTSKTTDYDIKKSKDEIRFVTISLVAEKKNHIYFLNILKEQNVPEGKKVVYDIYGPIKDNEYWQRCLRTIEELPKVINVNYKGSVIPTKVSETLQGYHFFVLPTLGENFGHAIFEALINRIPVLISDQTPWKDLEEKKAGWSISLNNVKGWNAVLKQLVNSKDSYKEFANGAENIAKEYIKISGFKSSYEELFK